MEKAHPSFWGTRGEQSAATSSHSLPAVLRPTSSRDTNKVYRSRIPVPVSRVASTGSQRPSQQSAASRDQAHSRPVPAPLGKQDPELPLPLTEEDISSTPVPGPEKSEKDVSLISQAEPSHVLKTSTRAGRHASQETHGRTRSRIPVPVPRVVSEGMQRPRQQPRARQEQAHSTPVSAPPGLRDQALPLLGKTEPSCELQTSTQAGRRASQETYAKHRSRIPVRVSRVACAGIQRPSQQPRAQQEQAHSTPVSPPLGRLPVTWCQRQVSGQDTEMFCVQMSQNLSGTSLPLPGKTGEYVSTMSQNQPVQELNTKHPASAEHRLPLHREANPQMLPDCVEANFPIQRGALAKEEKQAENGRPQELCSGNEFSDNAMSEADDKTPQDLFQKEYSTDEELSQAEKDTEKRLLQGEGSNDKELFQGENDAIWDIYDLWDYYLGTAHEQDAHTYAHQVPSSLSTLGTEAAAEAVAELRSTSAATAGATGSEPAGAATARAAEEEEHCAPVAPKAPEDARKASPAFGERVTVTVLERQAAAPHSPCSPLSPLPSWPETHGLSRARAVGSQRPSRFRRALRALSRLCRCACEGGRPED